METRKNEERANRLFIVGTILTFCGFLLSYGLPINKKIWSPTFVLTTCGLACSLFALLIWILDIKGWKRWSKFFEVFGINPLFLFCLSGVTAIVISAIKVPYALSDSGLTSLQGWFYRTQLVPLCGGDETFASLVFAIMFVLLMWLVGLVLYKKKIYIKL